MQRIGSPEAEIGTRSLIQETGRYDEGIGTRIRKRKKDPSMIRTMLEQNKKMDESQQHMEDLQKVVELRLHGTRCMI